jgi:hypothetical protein
MKMKKEKQITISKDKYETDIMMYGVFLMNKVKESLDKKEYLTIIIEEEFKKYKKQYLKNGSITD